MVHDEWLEQISAEADGELDAPESEQLADHLADCPSCRALLASFEAERRRARFRSEAHGEHLVQGILAARADEAGATRSVLAKRAAVAVAGVAAAVAALALFTGGAPDSARLDATAADPGDALIAARDQSFDRADIEIEAGTTVEWRNAGSTTHHLVRYLGGAKVDEDLPPGRTETATFEQPGTFRYYCTIHPEMSGTVTVDPR